MQHPTDIQMMEFIGGHLPPDQRDFAIEHLASCHACRSRHQELTEIWDILGQWELPAGEHDLQERVLAVAGAGRTMRVPGVWGQWTLDSEQLPEHLMMRVPGVWGQWTLVTLKTAASILLAVGVGYAAARWNRPSPAPSPNNIEQRVIASLYLDTFESGTPAGLSELILATAEPHAEEK